MFRFPDGLYTDVRIERTWSTLVSYAREELQGIREREEAGAFIRVYDGRRWFFGVTTSLEAVQGEIDRLAALTSPVRSLQPPALPVHRGDFRKFTANDLRAVPLDHKEERLRTCFPILRKEPTVTMWQAHYVDRRLDKRFCSSIGADLHFDVQLCGLAIQIHLAQNGAEFDEAFSKGASHDFADLERLPAALEAHVAQAAAFLRDARRLDPCRLPVILAPPVAGVFAHESFGHKSEADFMLGDPAMREEWCLGRQVGSEILTIVDNGTMAGSGYTPFDDEGTEASRTALITEGKLSGRLHSAETAAALGEAPTGNARAMSFEYEPIVRMTTTYIEPGSLSREELFAGIEDGVFVDTIKHGSGLSTFTLAPSMAYTIKHGVIERPVRISTITGTVFDTLGLIDGVSDKLELQSPAMGGCGKMEQFPLPVNFGGPYVRVRAMDLM